MIEVVDKNSSYIENLVSSFPNELDMVSLKRDLLENNFTKYATYIIDAEPTAFINYNIMYERAEIININVIDKYQDMKIASKLMEHMISDCIENDVKSITLEVKTTNKKALHLYNKYGFKEISIRKKYYEGIDAILMEKELM